MSGQIGLGLTLFTRDSNGLAVRVDPTHVFRKGDRVRVLLETNTEGYLYIFNTTDGGKPVMIYPNAELDEGGNYVQPHVPFEIPSSAAEAERLRWLTFDEYAGAERLFCFYTRAFARRAHRGGSDQVLQGRHAHVSLAASIRIVGASPGGAECALESG